jgi:uncharacterized membrane protein YqhA
MPKPNSEQPNILLKTIIATRFISVLAILSSLASAALILYLGTLDTIAVFQNVITGNIEAQGEIEPSVIVIIDLLEILDDFLVGLALLYFAYGIYSLFIQVRTNTEVKNEPAWLDINSISTLKKTLLELLVVLLSVVFVKGILENETIKILNWNILVIPISIVAIALSIRLMLSEEN